MRRNCCNDCKNCEMLIEGEYIVIIENKGFSGERSIRNAVKCGRFGQYAFSASELPKSEILDDFIYK